MGGSPSHDCLSLQDYGNDGEVKSAKKTFPVARQHWSVFLNATQSKKHKISLSGVIRTLKGPQIPNDVKRCSSHLFEVTKLKMKWKDAAP